MAVIELDDVSKAFTHFRRAGRLRRERGSRLVVIDHGRLVLDGSLAEIKRRFASHRTLVVDLAEPQAPLAIDGVEVVQVDGPRQWLRFHRDEHSAARLIARVSAADEVVDIGVTEPDIEEVIRHVYGAA